MAKALRILLIALVVLIVLVVGAVVLLPRVLDAGFVAEQVIRRVEARTGRDIVIAGPVSLSVFPWVGVDIQDVRLANAQGFGDDPMAAATQVQVRVKLMPLLSKRVEVGRARVEGLRLNLARDAQGRTNWADLLPVPADGAQGNGAPAPGAPEAAGAGLAGLTAHGVELADAQLRWRDAGSGRELTVSNLNVVLSEVVPGKPVTVDAGFALDSPGDGLALDATLDGGVLWAGADASVSDLVLTVTPRSGGRLPVGQTLTINSDLAWSASTRALRIPTFAVSAGPLKLDGQFTLDAASRPLAYQGQLRLHAFNARPVLAAFGVDLPVMQADDALSRVGLDATVAGQGARLRLEPLIVTLDESTIRGFAAWNAPGLAFDLATDALDVDRYRPPGDDAAATPGAAVTAGARQGGVPRFPIDGELRIGRLSASGLTVTDLRVPASAREGRLSLTPTAALYGGSYQGDIRIDGRAGPTKVALNERLAGVAIGDLLDDLQGGEGKLAGTANVGIRLSLTAADTDTLLRSLNGVVDLSVTNGALRGVNLGRLVRQARAALRGESLPEENEPPVTDFTELTASINLADGIARNNDLLAKSPLLRVTGEGQADLLARMLDYGLTLNVVATAQGQGGQDLEALRGVPIPVRIHGPFDAPEYRLDLEAMARQAAESKLREEAEERLGEKLQEELEGKIGEEGKGLLERLLNGQ